MFGVRLNETEIETDQHLLFLCKYSRNIVFVDILELEHFPELVSVWCHASTRIENNNSIFQGRPSCFFYSISFWAFAFDNSSFAYGSLSPFNQVRHIDLYMVHNDDNDDDVRESLRNPTTRRTSIHSLPDYKVQIVPLVKVS